MKHVQENLKINENVSIFFYQTERLVFADKLWDCFPVIVLIS